ncbi:MAG: thioredoxin-dependent thiol peroxidase [Candidatus Brocadiaceae bacterium]|nr:thioredoxin-dependent thiol peroxidase [Candidatus Brocadiaceae bacterium]
MQLKNGDAAPPFKLADQNGKEHELSDFQGQWVILYFYPKDNTPGCTREACAFRDNFAEYKKLKIKILGISADSVESHKKFVEKYGLPFTLLSDASRETVKQYGVWGKKKMIGKEYEGINRMSFLINPEGKIEKIYRKVKPPEHAEEVLNDRKQADS